jgi:hypothetical protein
MTAQQPRSYTRLAIAVIIVGIIVSTSIFTSSTLNAAKTTTTAITTDTFDQTVTILATVTSTSCDYVIPGSCPTGYTFTLSVSYNGPWNIVYEGYNEGCPGFYPVNSSACDPNLQTLSGSFDGAGSDSRNITVSGQGNGWTLCAQARKLDASDSVLTVYDSGNQNETSLPYGAASTCSEAAIG